jgi:hypothetical protein
MRVTKKRKMRWPRNLALWGEEMCVPRFGINPLNAKLNSICHLLALLGAHHIHHISRIRVNMKARRHLKNLSVDGRTILKCILKKWGGRVWTGLIWLRIGASDLLL